MSEADLRRESEEIGEKINYYYYLTGAIGAGKTTCLSYFGSFNTYEEWSETRPTELGKAWNDLTDTEREKLDSWIMKQFYLKNCKLLDQRTGIHIVDRTPLDPISFTEVGSIKNKADSIIKGLSPGKSARGPCSGHIILLVGEPEDMEARVVGRHKQSRANVISDMQEKLKVIFSSPEVTVVDTAGMSIERVIKSVLKVILFGKYNPVNLGNVLENYKENGLVI